MYGKRKKLGPVYAALGGAVATLGLGVFICMEMLERVAAGAGSSTSVLYTVCASSGITGLLVIAAYSHCLISWALAHSRKHK